MLLTPDNKVTHLGTNITSLTEVKQPTIKTVKKTVYQSITGAITINENESGSELYL